MIRLLRLRRLVQVAVLLLLAALPWLNRDGFTGMKGSLFAFDFFGLPFADPLGAVQIGLSGIIPGWRLIAGALVVLAVALCLGRIFCSWFCPFGFLSELVHAIRGRRPPKPLKHGFRSRAVIALVGLALVPLLGFPLLNQLSLPGGLSLGFLTAAAPLSSKTIHTVLEHLLFFAVPFLPVITVLAVELVTGERLWCRWVCPQSVLLALMARLPVAPRLRRTLSRCTCKGEPACRRACSLGLDPRNPRSASPLECTNCGACVLACSRVHGGPAALALGTKDGHVGEGMRGLSADSPLIPSPTPHPSSPKDFHAYRIPVRRFPGLSEAGLYCCALRQKRFPSPWRREPLEWQSSFFRVAGFPPCGFSTSWRKRGNGIRTVLWLSFWFLQPRCRVRPSLQARF